jgi:DNA-binding NtrC family response regulator
MSINALSSVLNRSPEAEGRPFADILDDGQGAQGVRVARACARDLPISAADGFTDHDEGDTKAAATPKRLAALRAELQRKFGFNDILSQSPLMHAVFHLIKDLAHANATVLIEGETGTGKEQVARAIHCVAAQRHGPFVAVNCAALSETLLESELFGHEKGAFTSAAGQRRGRFELAQGGTLFLDEVGDMPAAMQAKLLRVLQERSFERVGGSDTIKLDVRVMCASNRSLRQLVKDGQFREDLFYRLNVVKISLPPLCRRPEDIPWLAVHFIGKHTRSGDVPKRITARGLDVLLQHTWPGNVRELENSIECACVTSRDEFIDIEDLPPELIAPTTAVFPTSVDLESEYLRKALAQTHGHIGKCAHICGMSRRSVSLKMVEYHLDRLDFNEG